MKKLDKTKFNESIVLSNEQMKLFFGSCADVQYFFRCYQYSTKGNYSAMPYISGIAEKLRNSSYSYSCVSLHINNQKKAPS